jgi:hypothetical protein
LLLHVVDASHPGYPEQIAQVQSVLADIGAGDVPQLLIFNKMDALEDSQRPRLLQDIYMLDDLAVPRIFMSAQSGLNLDTLRQRLLQQAQAHAASLKTPELDHEVLDGSGENEDKQEEGVVEEATENVEVLGSQLSRVDLVEKLHAHKGLEDHCVVGQLVSNGNLVELAGFVVDISALGINRDFIVEPFSRIRVFKAQDFLAEEQHGDENDNLVESLPNNVTDHHRANDRFIYRVGLIL